MTAADVEPRTVLTTPSRRAAWWAPWLITTAGIATVIALAALLGGTP